MFSEKSRVAWVWTVDAKILAARAWTVMSPDVTPNWSNRRGRLACLVWLAVGAVVAAGATRPDYNASRAFGFELQQDFAKRHSAAVIDRVGEEALRRKTFAAYSDEVASSSEVMTAWKDVFYAGFLQHLKQLDTQEQMVLERVLSLNGTRLLECILVAKNGSTRLVYWELAEEPDGKIHIIDERMQGEELSYSRRLKHLFLLSGFSSTVLVGDEEMDLERESARCHERVREALAVMEKGAFDEAFRRWSDLPEEVKKTAIWRDIRFSMASRGGEMATKSLQADIQDGKPGIDPVLRYNAAMAHQDYPTALDAIDEVLMATYDAPLFQALKCELLTKTHRAKESLQMATNIYQLNPFTFAAYIQAAEAAAALDDLKAAQAVMHDWSQVYASSRIDDLVKTLPGLEKLRGSPAYREWLKAAPATAP